MLKSLDAYDQPLLVRDSQYFLLPLLSTRGSPHAPRERLHTLSQLFLEIEDHHISPYTIHLQVYTYNDIFAQVLRKKLWFAPGLRDLLIGPLQHRLLLIQGYLHSRHSGKMRLRLERQLGPHRERLLLEGESNAEAIPLIHRVIDQLRPVLRRAGLRPLLSGLDITRPGRGFHCGGSFPMRTDPHGFETDPMGRPAGMSRVHLVDASVFPSIPATTITFTAMANAHRIASDRGGVAR
jgi:choline dehydrogenase-like flavoprotein